MNTNKQDALIVERLIFSLTEVGNRLQELHPRRAISLLRTRVTSIVSTFQCYDLLDSVRLLGFLMNLFDMYFERKLRTASGEELENSSVPQSVASMLKREFRSLSVDDHFDYDYILKFDTLEEDLTTLAQMKHILTEEDYRNVQTEIVACITRAEDGILAELQQLNQRLIEDACKELTEKRTVQSLEVCLRNMVREMHSRMLGWP